VVFRVEFPCVTVSTELPLAVDLPFPAIFKAFNFELRIYPCYDCV
jgi:hypothetical protein